MTSANDDAGFQSLTGALESAEPAPAHQAPAPTTTTTTTKEHSAPTPAADDTAAAMKHQTTLSGGRSLNVSGTPSPKSSLSSRDASPARPHQRSAAQTGTSQAKAGLRSRKSSIEASPNRAANRASGRSSPSPAALQRALSSTSIPELPATSSVSSVDTIKAPRPSKATSGSNSGDNALHWPISPRLRSPPPPGSDSRSGSRSRANSLRNQIRKPESQSTPAIVVQSSSPAPASRIPVREDPAASDPDEPAMSIKGPSRGASGAAPKLETVQESSLPATPGFDGLEADSFISSSTSSQKPSDEERNDVSSSKVTEDLSTKNTNDHGRHTGSGSDSGPKSTQKGKMQEQRSASAHRPTRVTSKPSLSSLSTRSATQPPLRNMTVETETVPSVPQSTIGNSDRSASGRADGSLRLKPSNETIRPKKDRKPHKRGKAQSSTGAGTASSKADVFETKVARAVDEADSSDSDATFIYESNPPLADQPHRSRQNHHSRTPSMTSLTSLADPRLAIRDAHKNPNKKSSMKFTNSFNNPGADPDPADRGDGTMRIGSGRAGGGSQHHHHIGRHGQGRGALNHLMLDSDSSMPQSSRARGPSSRQASQPNSPRFHAFAVGNGHSNGSKKNGEYSAYDMDAEHAADDERTPLISSRGSQRVRTPRRRNSLTIRVDRRHRHGNGLCRRFAGCLVLSILLLVVVFSSVGLVFATTKPLASVEVQGVQNVVASQEEIILDLIVDAVNPNIIGVTVPDLDVSIFAKSKHVGSDKWWRHHGEKNNEEEWRPVEDDFVVTGIDEGTDPIEGEPRMMSLGRILHFDSPLTYEGSFWAHKRASSIGEIRLTHPGNKTEVGGPERWEEVLQHPFELVVRGVLKYQLPLSTHVHTSSITASYYYDPDAEKKKFKLMQSGEDINSGRLPRAFISKAPGRYDRRLFPIHRW